MKESEALKPATLTDVCSHVKHVADTMISQGVKFTIEGNSTPRLFVSCGPCDRTVQLDTARESR